MPADRATGIALGHSRPRAASQRHALAPFLRRLAQLGVLIVGCWSSATVGFVLTEDVSVWLRLRLDARHDRDRRLDPRPGPTGGRSLKVVLIVLGVGTLFYALVTVTEFFVAGHLADLLDERRTQRMIESLTDHHLICGFGRVGRQVARDLRAAGRGFVVIDTTRESRELAEAMGAPFIEGQPSDDDGLRAGRDRARARA